MNLYVGSDGQPEFEDGTKWIEAPIYNDLGNGPDIIVKDSSDAEIFIIWLSKIADDPKELPFFIIPRYAYPICQTKVQTRPFMQGTGK